MKYFDSDKLNLYLSAYKKELPSFWNDEKYKWEAVQCFQKNWNIDSPDFGQMLKAATRKHLNLLASGNYFPLGMLQEFIEVDAERVRGMFKQLFDENVSIIDRIASYRSEAEKLRLTAPKKWKNHYQDIRAISVFLWMRYPEKYYIFKYKELHKAVDLIGSDFSTKDSTNPSFYVSFLELMDSLCSILSQDNELKHTLETLIINDQEVFPDKNYHIATVDFVFYVGKRYQSKDNNTPKTILDSEKSIMNPSIKEQFRSYLSNCVQTKRQTGKTFLIGQTTVDSYVSFAEVDKLFDYSPKQWENISSIYDITSSQEILSIIDKLTEDEDFKTKDSSGTSQYFRSNAIKQYYCFLKAREIICGQVPKNALDKNENPNIALQQPLNITPIVDKILSTGLIYSETLIKRLAYSLMAKPFVILSGLAGSGKTQLALAFAKCLSENIKEQVCSVSIGADWTNREPLLGYPNALQPGKYEKPESGVLQLLMRANEDPSKPYFLILDEMNLSVVERYFADFLSAMESGEPIKLWDNEKGNVPKEIELPKNVFIIGTINVDETTYMFSPKVLDRANVIEFKIAADEMEDYLGKKVNINLEKAYSACADMAVDFVSKAKSQVEKDEKNKDVLLSFFKELKEVNAEFGYRTVNEISRYLHFNDDDENGIKGDEAIDTTIVQKLLPKLHGSRKKLEPVLKQLWKLCFTGADRDLVIAKEHVEKARFKESADKIRRMYESAYANGFTSFAEA